MRSNERSLDQLALRRARAKAGWWMHATVFAIVNLAMTAISMSSGRGWAIYPFLGWGVGLALHGAGVGVLAPGGGVKGRLVARERAKLQARDPW